MARFSRGMAVLAFLCAVVLAAAVPLFLFLRGWIQYRRLEKSIVEKMDQYYLNVTVPGREDYLLADDEMFEVPYMASKLSVQAVPTRIYDIHDRLIGEYISEKGLYVRDPGEIPLLMKKALVATEDGDFYNHHGFNYKAFARAMLTNLKRRRLAQGGSTLTQQLSKILFTTRHKTYGRKIYELFAALKMEQKFTKDQILLLYLNFAYFGHGCFGIESASQFYFGKHASDLQLGEAAMLAGIIANPDRYSPYANLDLTKARHRTVLTRMASRGYIPASSVDRYADDFWAAMSERFLKNPEVSFWRMSINKSPTFIEHVRRSLAKEYSKERIMKGGLKVYTTLDLELQDYATQALQSGLTALNEEAESQEKRPERVEGGLAAVRPTDGALLALVGGSAFNFQNQFNRAADISRQIGSCVKPFIYAVAFASGFKPEDQVMDEPAHYKMARGRMWTPHNYEGNYLGRVTLATALHKSLNSVAVQLLTKVDMDRVIRLLSDATGVPAESLPRNLSLALGTAQASPLQLAAAYSIFANGGKQVRPYFIRTIEDRDGNILRDDRPKEDSFKQVLDSTAALIARQTMRGVLEEGGSAYAAARRAGFSIPAAGKTGTTSDYKDAWFAGVTPDLSAAVWIGYDDMRIALGQGKSGGRVAAPIWMRFVKDAYRNRPTREFDMSGVKR